MRRDKKNNMNGFTLIEVLVAMVVMAIGLLGLASLQALALKDNQDAYFRSQANLLIYEMGDRIRANPAYWSDQASVNSPIVEPVKNCSETPNGSDTLNPCTDSQEMADYDNYHSWQAMVAILPNPSLNITRTDLVIHILLSWERANQPALAEDDRTPARLNLDVQL